MCQLVGQIMPHFYTLVLQNASFFQKGNANRKIGQIFAGFFYIFKTRKTVPQLNRTKTLQPVKRNADIILFTHWRAYKKILFIMAQ